MDKMQKINSIRYIFQRGDIPVSDEKIQALADIAQEVSFAKQDVILDINEKQTCLYLILQGMARSYYIDEKGKGCHRTLSHLILALQKSPLVGSERKYLRINKCH